MPTFEQAHFIARALESLFAQTASAWEAIIVDDGSRDDTPAVVRPYLQDGRVRYLRLPHNTGLGNALNVAMEHASAPLLAYLPSDDVYYRDHLQALLATLAQHSGAVLAYAGMRHRDNRYAAGQLETRTLQLVQCMHRKTEQRWTVREELESDDLERLFWHKLRAAGSFADSGVVSCEWVDHPAQRHKLMQEPLGGINPFRQYYRVSEALIFHSTTGNAIDERTQYHAMRARPPTPRADDALRILLVGELAYNADRVLALEEHGHKLYGLWMRDPHWCNTIGPLPFGHVEDLSFKRWREEINRVRPDVIYALLNWQAVPLAHAVMMATPGIPFVWHFKEGPFSCLEKGSWPQLVDLFEQADGRIFSSPEMRDWFDTAIPGLSASRSCHVLDGDLPKKDWFDAPFSALVSQADGQVHTVLPGRPIGLHPHTVAELGEQGVHLHCYGDYTQGQWRAWIDKARTLAPRHLHLHAHVDQSRWVDEFSRYDAGWLHAFASDNGGELRRANWDELHYPARMATMAAAGLPMIQRASPGAVVATESLARRLGIGVFYDSVPQLAAIVHDKAHMQAVREAVWRARMQFSFDTHVPDLIAFLRRVIAGAGARARGTR